VISHQSSVSSDQLSAKYERPGYLSELGKKLEERYEEAWRIQEIRERLAQKRLEAGGAGTTSPREALALEAKASNLKARRADPAYAESTLAGRPTYAEAASAGRPPTFNLVPDPQAGVLHPKLVGGPAVKLLVKEEGWYRVSRRAIEEAGLSPIVYPGFLHLYTGGKEVAIRVVDKLKRADSWEAIEFYGMGVDTLSTDTRVYWLVTDYVLGQRIGNSEMQGGRSAGPSFLYTAERRDRTFYFPALKNGDESNFFGPPIYEPQGAVEQIVELRNLDRSAPGDAVLEIGVQGAAYAPHAIKVFVNDIEVGTLSWEGQVAWTGTFSVPQSILLDGENLVTLLPMSGDMIVSLLDYIRLTYWHTYRADGDELRCQAKGGKRVSVDGFSTPKVRVFDITDPRNVVKVERKVKRDGTGGFRATFTVPGNGERTVLALTEEKFKSPAEILANRPSSWNEGEGYDFLIIAHRNFIKSVRPLKAQRESEGLSVGVVDIEDIYDEFSFGEKSAKALKKFLRYARDHWSPKPKYVLLVGDASYDPRDYSGFGDQDYVPTKLVDTFHLETASDDWFVDFNNDGLPETAIGRLPVQTKKEADAVIKKIVRYKKSNPMSEALLVADQVGQGDFDFEGSSEALETYLSASLGVRKIFRSQYGSDAEAREALLGGIDEGPLLVNYAGHGSVGVWRGDLLTLTDAEALTNRTGFPLFVNMTCLNGFFQAPYTDTLGEVLIKRSRGGAVAVWTSSGLTAPNEQALMNVELMRLLFGAKSTRLGEAARRAKAATTDQDVRKSWILFGDPSMRLRME
jgi:hypothetical protein